MYNNTPKTLTSVARVGGEEGAVQRAPPLEDKFPEGQAVVRIDLAVVRRTGLVMLHAVCRREEMFMYSCCVRYLENKIVLRIRLVPHNIA